MSQETIDDQLIFLLRERPRNKSFENIKRYLRTSLNLGLTLGIAFLTIDGYFRTDTDANTIDNTVNNVTNKIEETISNTSELKNPKTNNLYHDDEVTLLARVIFGESRQNNYGRQNKELQRTVAYTVINRSGKNKWWGHTLKEVMLKQKNSSYQYNCFNKRDPNRKKVMDPWKYEDKKLWAGCYSIAKEAIDNPQKDNSDGPTHYYDTSMKIPSYLKGKKPVKVISCPTYHFPDKKIKFYHLKS